MASTPLRRVPIFAAAFLLVAAERTLISLSRADEYQPIELYNGSLAWALVSGMPLDPTTLPVIEHLRGSVIFGLLLAPIYALLGPGLLGLRLLAVCWSALTAGIFATVLERRVGRPAAWWGIAVFALLPPAFQVMDVQALGSHADSVAFLFAVLLLLPTPERPAGVGRTLAIGAAASLGVLFSYQCAVALPALFAAWWASDRGVLRRRRTLLVPLVFAVAAVPAAFLSRSPTIMGRSALERLLPDGIGGAGAKLAGALTDDVRHSWLYEELGGAAWPSWVLYGALLVGLATMWRRIARLEPLALFCTLYPLCLLGAYAVSDFELVWSAARVEYAVRFLLPMQPALATWVVFGVLELGARVGRTAAAVYGGVALTAMATGLVALVDPGVAFDGPPVRGTYYPGFRNHFGYAADGDPRAMVEWALRLDDEWLAVQPLSHNTLGPSAFGDGKPPWPPAPDVAAGVDGVTRPFLLVWLGAHYSQRTDEADIAAAARTLSERTDRAWFLLGAGKGMLDVAATRSVLADEVRFESVRALEQLRPEDGVLAARGAGFRLGRVASPNSRLDSRLLRAGAVLSADLRREFFFGVGLGYRTRFREAAYRAPDPGATALELGVPAADREAFRAGLSPAAAAF